MRQLDPSTVFLNHFLDYADLWYFQVFQQFSFQYHSVFFTVMKFRKRIFGQNAPAV